MKKGAGQMMPIKSPLRVHDVSITLAPSQLIKRHFSHQGIHPSFANSPARLLGLPSEHQIHQLPPDHPLTSHPLGACLTSQISHICRKRRPETVCDIRMCLGAMALLTADSALGKASPSTCSSSVQRLMGTARPMRRPDPSPVL